MTTKQLTRFDEVKAGDKVKVLDADKIEHGGRLVTGQVYDVLNVDPDGDFRLTTEGGSYVYIVKHERRGLAKIEGKDPVIERLDTLEKLVREQGDLIRQMKEQQGIITMGGVKVVQAPKAVQASKAVEVVSQNTLRKQVIEDATEDVKNIMRRFHSVKIEFIVNEKKRVVTVLAKSSLGGKVIDKAIAKAAPGDVFNAEIGKAIALRRLLSKTIPKMLTHAVQPDEVVVGHMLEVGQPELYEVIPSSERVSKNKAQLGSEYGSFGRNKRNRIMSDTKAQY